MNLPEYLLPAGALTAMRQTANDFMTQEMAIYAISLAYDKYGQQVVTSGLLATVTGYFGAVKGRDKELLSQTLQAYTRRDGVRVSTDALVLLPFETTIENDQIVRVNDKDYHVVWNNTDTQDSVQLYTKAIVVHFMVQDEKINTL